MAEKTKSSEHDELLEINIKDPAMAALLAWLWPGAGHLYQQRYGKGILFMVCILGTFFFGLTIGGGHVVYASWTKTDKRLPYLCQVGAGLPALPALVQNYRVMNGKEPIKPFGLKIMAPPRQPVDPHNRNNDDELAQWHEKYGMLFDMGTLYTMIAGLLNVLVIYDAFAGPVFVLPEEETDRPPPEDE